MDYGNFLLPPGRARVKLATALLLLIGAAATLAQPTATIETELTAEILAEQQLPNGQRQSRFVPAISVAQGQTVYYTVRIRNPTSVPARDVEVVRRIPMNTQYVAGSAAGPSATIEFSIDGGATFAEPSQLLVIDAMGTRLASPEEYTHIRWRLRHALAPGATALARFQAVFR